MKTQIQIRLAYITSSHENDYIQLEVTDEKSSLRFLTAAMSLADLTKLTTGSRSVYVDASVDHLNFIGKKMENKKFEFPIPDTGYDYKGKAKAAELACEKVIPEGWISDNYYNSRDSFFTADNGIPHARVTIRRWV